MGRKKLCLVIPSLQAGGMERVMSELAQYFSKKGNIEIHLVLYGISREIFFNLPGEVIIHKPSFQFNNRFRIYYTLRTSIFLRDIISQIKPDSVLSFGEYWNSLVLISLARMDFPIFISDRCSPVKRFNIGHAMLRRIFYPQAKGIIAQTEKAREIYSVQKLNRNIRVIGNPVRINNSENIQKEKIVLSVGRLIGSKNHEKLINIFLDLNMSDWRLIIVGEDHLKQDVRKGLEEIIMNRGSQDRVILAGKRSDVDLFYNRSLIFATTSESEGFPNVIGEAMSAGLPVVAFDCIAGPSDLVRNDETGFLVPLYDYDAFRGKLETLMNNEALRQEMGEKAKEKIKEFSVERIGEEYLNFIN